MNEDLKKQLTALAAVVLTGAPFIAMVTQPEPTWLNIPYLTLACGGWAAYMSWKQGKKRGVKKTPKKILIDASIWGGCAFVFSVLTHIAR